MPLAAARLRLSALLLVGLWLGGCATVEPPATEPVADPQAAWHLHEAWLQTLTEWDAVGRVAVRVPDDSWSARLSWKQAGEAYRIQLSGPLGQGAVRIEGDVRGVELRRGDGKVVRAESAEALLAAELGWQVPVEVLRHWMIGRPAPARDVDAIALDGSGRLRRLQQAGWEVRFMSYANVAAGALPSRLEIRRADVWARVLLTGWRLAS